LKSVPPPFHVWPAGCCTHPILYFKNVASLLLNSGDGPVLLLIPDSRRPLLFELVLSQLYKKVERHKTKLITSMI